MGGTKGFRKLEFALEATPGLVLPATTLWRGKGVIDDGRVIEYIDEDVGLLPGDDRTEEIQTAGAIELEATPFTFEQFPYLCAMGIKNVTTGVADGAGSGKIYDYDWPVDSLNTIKTGCFRGGDESGAEIMEYGFAEKFGLQGEGGGLLMMNGTILGRQVAASTFTGGLTLPTVAGVQCNKGKLYTDSISGTIGTTQITSTLFGVKLEFVTGWKPAFYMDGVAYFSIPEMSRPHVSGTLTVKHNSSAINYKTYWRAQTAKIFRLIWQGPALASAGTAYTYKTLIVDFAAKILKVSKLGEKDGNDIVEVTVDSRRNATAALYGQIIVVNELASLP